MDLGRRSRATSATVSALSSALVSALAMAVAAVVLAALPASAAAATALTVSAPAAYADAGTTASVVLTADGAALPGATVHLERFDGAAWVPVADLTTDAAGRASTAIPLSRDPARNRLRARYDGDATTPAAGAETAVALLARPTVALLGGPTRVVDETSSPLSVIWRTTAGAPVSGRVVLQRWTGRAWNNDATLTTDSTGRATFRVRPRVDTRYRVAAVGTPWAAPAVSGVARLDNVPVIRPVRMPKGAPRPRRSVTPPARATTAGADARITAIPDDVWRSMVGRSWHAGCPVGRSSLRLLRINYWDYQGYRRRGELVAAASAVRQMAGALADMYAARLPIRSMVRVDRFGWSKRVRGADDYASMAAGNTSAFNCRWVVGRPGRMSPHTYGRALDINTWENPFHASHGWTPNTWWVTRSDARIAWRSRNHRVVRIMAKHGLRWTYGTSDSQHFDVVTRGGARVPADQLPPACTVAAECH